MIFLLLHRGFIDAYDPARPNDPNAVPAGGKALVVVGDPYVEADQRE